MRLLAWCVVVVAVCGCPVVGETDAGVDAGVDHCSQYVDAYCTRLTACGIADSVAACAAPIKRECRSVLSNSYKGKTRIEPSATARCLQGIAESPCSLVEDARFACLSGRDFVVPSSEVGAVCDSSVDACVSGFCSGDHCGVCAATVADGEPCGACGRQSFCNRQNQCEALRSDGSACLSRSECSSGICNVKGTCGPTSRSELCESERECVSTEFCLGLQLASPASPGRCQPRTPAAALCQRQQYDSADGCERGTRCLDGRCSAPAAGSLAPGAECGSDTQCQPDSFCEQLTLDTPGHCVAPRVGGPCVGEQQHCPTAARCIVDTCRALRKAGESCSTADDRWDDCLVGLACVEGVCAPPVAEGQACQHGYQCVWGTCPGGVCTPPGGAGTMCLLATDCSSRACVFSGLSSTGTCEASCY